jgi:hypothetical protein
VPSQPVSDEIAGALALFFTGGSGPTHASLSGVFARSGYGDADPYRPPSRGHLGGPNKEARVLAVVRTAVERPARARELIDGLLALLSGYFRSSVEEHQSLVATAQSAFRRVGWSLSAEGRLHPFDGPNLETGGRQALDEQLGRLRSATNDPGQLLGSAKDLLEAVAKFVLEELEDDAPDSFGSLLYAARTRLGIHPKQVAGDNPGSDQVRKIVGAAWTIAEQVNELRGLQGAGHGRTLPTGVTPELAMLVVRETCSVAQFLLDSLDACQD